MKFFVKRVFDTLLALFILIVFSPIVVIVALLIWMNLGWPVVYRQKRPGYKGKIFTIYKFRSMRDAKGKDGRDLPDEERLTRFGILLRRSSLDELPELFNVLKGEMGLVGPRPLLVEYLEKYSPEQARRHDVLPGITGWAQVHGRVTISYEEKFKYDVWYVDHWSLWLDIKILFMTLWQVVRRKDVETPGVVGHAGWNPPAAQAQPTEPPPPHP